MRIFVKKKGMVLVGVLWLVIILTVIVATTGRSSRIDTKMMTSRVEDLRCRWAGRAGIERGLAILAEDEADIDGMLDPWANNPGDLNDIPLEGCRFTVRIVDESSKLNVNTATREQLLMLPNMTEDIADAIIDWRDSDDTPGDFGAESGYYATMPYPYQPRNGPFQTIRELLLVKDITEELLYGEDTNFNGKLDLNERDGDMSPPNDDGDNELDLGWIAYLTCYTGSSGGGTTSPQGGGATTTTGGTQARAGGTPMQMLATVSVVAGGSQPRGGAGNRADQTGQRTQSGQQGRADQAGQQTQSGQQGRASQTGQQTLTGQQGRAGQTGQQGLTGQQGAVTGQQGQTAQQGQTDGTTTADTSGGPVNVNTASEIVLAALLGASDVTYEDAYVAARSIVNYRDQMGEGLSDVSELLDGGAIEQDVFDRISGKLTTSSNVFSLYCISVAERGNVDGARWLTEVVVDRSSSPANILYWHQGTGY